VGGGSLINALMLVKPWAGLPRGRLKRIERMMVGTPNQRRREWSDHCSDRNRCLTCLYYYIP
jgi:hypothetical protein